MLDPSTFRTMLDPSTFRTVVASAPLIAIDLIVQDPRGRALLGRRRNRPAQGDWFVPGGRVLKNERLDEAFRRLTGAELGRRFERSQASWLGVFEHFYADSAFGAGEGAPDTHYVVLAYRLAVPAPALTPPDDQHEECRWLLPEQWLEEPSVHEHARAYLRAL